MDELNNLSLYNSYFDNIYDPFIIKNYLLP